MGNSNSPTTKFDRDLDLVPTLRLTKSRSFGSEFTNIVMSATDNISKPLQELGALELEQIYSQLLTDNASDVRRSMEVFGAQNFVATELMRPYLQRSISEGRSDVLFALLLWQTKHGFKIDDQINDTGFSCLSFASAY